MKKAIFLCKVLSLTTILMLSCKSQQAVTEIPKGANIPATTANDQAVQPITYQSVTHQPQTYPTDIPPVTYQPETYQTTTPPVTYQPETYQTATPPVTYQPETYQTATPPVTYQPETYQTAKPPVTYQPETYQTATPPVTYQPETYQTATPPTAYQSVTNQMQPENNSVKTGESVSFGTVPRNEKFAMAEGEKNLTAFGKKYHVVVGSFRNQDNARGLQRTLNAQGNDALIVVNEQGMFRVLIASFNEHIEADRKIDRIKYEFPDAWVLIQRF
ncbi:MAG: SPOR domain-containing protein [Prevotellaceae bacterium]|jgi:cell division protein FtsN|nr:SPOR domain-containing protein [Prevotellaceae bacterium]